MYNFANIFIEFGNQIKIYHWRTKSFARHKATDKFLELYSNNLDKLIETTMGCNDKRINGAFDVRLENYDDRSIVEYVKNFRQFLEKDFNNHVEKKDTDLLNIRDEILGDVNRMLYLFTLK